MPCGWPPLLAPAATAFCRLPPLTRTLALAAGQHGGRRRGPQQCRGAGSRAGGGPDHPPLGHCAAAAGARRNVALAAGCNVTGCTYQPWRQCCCLPIISAPSSLLRGVHAAALGSWAAAACQPAACGASFAAPSIPAHPLQNVVATVNLECKLDLKNIALHARNAEYNPKVGAAAASGFFAALGRGCASTANAPSLLVAGVDQRQWCADYIIAPAPSVLPAALCGGHHAHS